MNSKLSSYNSQPQSVYEMAALTDTLDTQDVTTKIKESLMQHNIGQKIFGEGRVQKIYYDFKFN